MNWPDDYLVPGIEPYHVEEAGIIYNAEIKWQMPIPKGMNPSPDDKK